MRRRLASPLVLGLAAATLVAGCGPLPRGAAIEREILRGQSQDFAVYPVTPATLPLIEAWPAGGERTPGSWLPRQRGPASLLIGPGDAVDVAIWDTGENSLLAAPGQRVVAMPGMEVGPAGEIFLPYVGAVTIANMTPEAARETVARQIEAVLPSAEVQLGLAETGRGNTVDLVGGVISPGAVPLPDRNFTVLGLIGRGGGVVASLRNPRVRLVRDGRDYLISLDRLYAEPDLDTTLRGGDQVIVLEDARSFVVLGAAAREQVVAFDDDEITALEAVAMAGGVQDARGDPQGILVLREYPPETVRDGPGGPDHARVVFTLDLTSAEGLFAAGSFLIRPGDLVLATESPVTALQTVLGLVGSSFGVYRQGLIIDD